MDELEPAGADGSYVEESTLVRLLGTPGKVRIIDVFLGKHYVELSAAQVADLAGIDVSTFHRNVDVLVDLGIVEETRTVGGTQLFSLDTDHPVSKALGRARSELLEHAEAFPGPAGDDGSTGVVSPATDTVTPSDGTADARDD